MLLCLQIFVKNCTDQLLQVLIINKTAIIYKTMIYSTNVILLMVICIIFEIHIISSEILNLRHSRSKDRHLYGRSRTLWGLQAFDNISWSYALLNETDGLELLETSFVVKTANETHTDAGNLKFSITFNETNDILIGQVLNENMIIDTYLRNPIGPNKMSQSELTNILNYVSDIPNPDDFGPDASRLDLTFETISKNKHPPNLTLNKDSFEEIEIRRSSSFQKIAFQRQKKNNQFKNPTPHHGYDILTEHLQIIESQNAKDCTAGTSKSLGEGVVDNSRFQIEANVAVNRANMLTRYLKT